MLAQQARNRSTHGIDIQWLVHMPGAMEIKRRRRRTIEYLILIDPRAPIAARVEGIRDDLDIFDRDIERGKSIQAAPDAMRFEFFVGEKIYHLTESMYPGVSAAGPGNPGWRRKKRADGPLRNALKRIAFGLVLPATVIGTVVFDGKLDVHAECFRVSGLASLVLLKNPVICEETFTTETLRPQRGSNDRITRLEIFCALCRSGSISYM